MMGPRDFEAVEAIEAAEAIGAAEAIEAEAVASERFSEALALASSLSIQNLDIGHNIINFPTFGGELALSFPQALPQARDLELLAFLREEPLSESLSIERTDVLEKLPLNEAYPFKSIILLAFMKSPHLTCDGRTDELSAVKEWFRRSGKSPRTNARLDEKKLVPNHALRQVMQTLIRLIQEERIHTAKETKQEDAVISRALLTAPTAKPAESLRCPLSGLLLVDPVTTIDGETFQKTHPLKWSVNWAIRTLARHAATFLLAHHTPERMPEAIQKELECAERPRDAAKCCPWLLKRPLKDLDKGEHPPPPICAGFSATS